MQTYAKAMPYPKPEGALTLQDARILADNLGARASETTAIFQYIFQHGMIDPTIPQLADDLRGIAIAEMHHYDLLSEALVACGAVPYVGGKACFWSGSYVNYVRAPLAAVRADIAAEKQAIADYRRSILRLRNESLKALLERIIEDEEEHIRILSDWETRLRGE